MQPEPNEFVDPEKLDAVRAKLQRMAELSLKIEQSPYIPITPTAKQMMFCLDERREVFYGGQLGGGKSVAQLAAALMHVDKPGYYALLIRRTYADLSKPGALMSMADEWLYNTDAKRKEKGKEWHFPSGAKLVFGYMENDTDKLQYQGSNWSYVGYDEASQFTPSQLKYLFSRLRQDKKTSALGIPLRYRLTSNPGHTSHEYLRDTYVRPKVPDPNKLYIPAGMNDNPYLEADEYREMLQNLDVIERAQLVEGDWFVTPEGGFFKNNFPAVPRHLSAADWGSSKIVRCRTWDFAASTNADGDFAVGMLVAYDPVTRRYRIEHVARAKATPADIEALVLRTIERDGGLIPQVVEQERGSAGVMVQRDLRTRLMRGAPVYFVLPSGDKLARARLGATLVDAGDVELEPATWNEALILEFVGFPEMRHDDQVDTFSHAVHWIAKQMGGTRVVSTARASISHSTASQTQTTSEVATPRRPGLRVIRTNQGPGPLDRRYG